MGRAIDMEKDIDMLKREVKGVKDNKKETKKTNAKRSKASSGKSASRPDSSEQQS